jgi:phenylpropionate dioxygenase-like ring-hydroxylating dioxygenase large terminal subunit
MMDSVGKSPSYDFTTGWALNPDADAASFEAKAPYVDNGTGLISPDRYYDPAVMRAEWDRLWTRTWQIAGRVSDIAETGDFLKFDCGGESIIVVRTAGGLRAFYNVCQHRGTRLVHTDFGNATKFRCIFHSWAWTIEGKIDQVTDWETFRPETLHGGLNLPEVRCDIWGGFVFICMDAATPPLQECLDILPAHLKAYRFESMVVVKDVEVLWPVNWKTALDAFLESYHVHAVHSEILPFYDDYHQQWDLYANGMSRMLMMFAAVSPRYEDQKSINPVLRGMLAEAGIDPAGFTGDAAAVRKAIQAAKMSKLAPAQEDGAGYVENQMTDDWAYFIFPNVTLNVHPEGVLVQRFRPHATDPEKVIYDVTVLVHPIHDPQISLPGYMGVPAGTDCSGNVRPERVYLTPGDGGLGPVLEQDGALVPLVQAGQRSRGFRGSRLSEQEQRIRHYHREIERYLRGEKWQA